MLFKQCSKDFNSELVSMSYKDDEGNKRAIHFDEEESKFIEETMKGYINSRLKKNEKINKAAAKEVVKSE